MQCRWFLPASCLLAIGLSAVTFQTPSVHAQDARKATAPSFATHAGPFLTKYCIGCHSGAKPKADLNLKAFSDEASVVRARKLWVRLKDYVESGEMPPEDEETQPSQEEVEKFLGWIDTTLSKVDCTSQADPGRVTIRRLNRAEYNNTIRDLVGIDFQPADDFPSDDVGYGFDNIGDVLTLPPILFEKYLEAAEKIAEQAIVAGPSGSKGPIKSWEAGDLPDSAGGLRFGDGSRILASSGSITTTHVFPRDAEYILRARAFGQQAGPEPARMAFLLDGKALKTVDVTAVEKEPEALRAPRQARAAALASSPWPSSTITTTRKTPTPRIATATWWSTSSKFKGRRVDRRRAAARVAQEDHLQDADEGEQGARSPARSSSGSPPGPTAGRSRPGEVGAAGQVRRPGRAERRQLRARHPARRARPSWSRRSSSSASSSTAGPGSRSEGRSAEPGPGFPDRRVRAGLAALVLPLEQHARRRARPASPVDGKLREGDNLEKQVRRMLRDPKSKALVENFAGQWLQLRNLKTVNPDRGRFPTFDEPLRAAMLKETELFFEAVMQRGPERPRLPRRRLHVRQRAAGEALRHRRRQGRRVPPRHAARTAGAAAC